MKLLANANNARGPLSPEVQQQIRAYLLNPTPAGWVEIRTLVIRWNGPINTVWQALVALDSEVASGRRCSEDRSEAPAPGAGHPRCHHAGSRHQARARRRTATRPGAHGRGGAVMTGPLVQHELFDWTFECRNLRAGLGLRHRPRTGPTDHRGRASPLCVDPAIRAACFFRGGEYSGYPLDHRPFLWPLRPSCGPDEDRQDPQGRAVLQPPMPAARGGGASSVSSRRPAALARAAPRDTGTGRACASGAGAQLTEKGAAVKRFNEEGCSCARVATR